MSENKENKEKKGKEWKFDDFKIGKSIGKGRFGSVYIAKEKKSSYVVGMLSAVFYRWSGRRLDRIGGTTLDCAHWFWVESH